MKCYRWISFYWVKYRFLFRLEILVFHGHLCNKYRLMHAIFHSRTVIIPRDRYRPEGFSTRVDISRGMITVLIWKKAFINLFITYFNIELKRTKLTSQTHTKLWVIDIGWGMITVLIGERACINIWLKVHIIRNAI